MRISDWSSDVCSSDLVAVPAQPQPGEVGEDRLDMLGAAARAVDILDPEQEPPAAGARGIMRADRREGVAEMQPPGRARREPRDDAAPRSEEHTSELQSLMRISYAVFCLKKKKNKLRTTVTQQENTYNIKYNKRS